MAAPDPLFIVWGPSGPTNPKVTHAERQHAIRAAREMARLNRGQRFYVMVATDLFEATDVQHTVMLTTADRIDDIPF